MGVFQTPSNEQSFSSLIDDVILATGRPGALINAVQYANLTIRECQAFGLFALDLVEDSLTADAEPYIWTRPDKFRRLRTVKYPGNAEEEWPKLLLPGRQQRNVCQYYYASDTYFVFKGLGVGSSAYVAYYKWANPLAYYGRLGQDTSKYPGGTYANRLAYYDTNLGKWQYLVNNNAYADTTGNAATDLSYQALSSHWLTRDWRDLIVSGTKSKVWNSGNDPRGQTEYAAYKATQKLLQHTIGYESEGF